MGRFHSKSGGEGENRTHGQVAPSPVFKTGAFGRSATSPLIELKKELQAIFLA